MGVLLWFLWLAVLVAASFFHARKEKSFYFLLIAILYGYVGLSYSFFQLLDFINGDSMIYLGMWYFMASCGGIIYFLVNHKKIVNKFFGNLARKLACTQTSQHLVSSAFDFERGKRKD
jgi:hypothetical protein